MSCTINHSHTMLQVFLVETTEAYHVEGISPLARKSSRLATLIQALIIGKGLPERLVRGEYPSVTGLALVNSGS
jgi:hypothetical protein